MYPKFLHTHLCKKDDLSQISTMILVEKIRNILNFYTPMCGKTEVNLKFLHTGLWKSENVNQISTILFVEKEVLCQIST